MESSYITLALQTRLIGVECTYLRKKDPTPLPIKPFQTQVISGGGGKSSFQSGLDHQVVFSGQRGDTRQPNKGLGLAQSHF